MSDHHKYGEIISKDIANTLIDNRDKLAARVKPILQGKLVPADFSFYDNDINAFVFSKTLIDELFSKTPAENGKNLDVLVVALASENKKGNAEPTVVLVACTSKEDKNGKITVTAPQEKFSPCETPPTIFVTELKFTGEFVFTEK